MKHSLWLILVCSSLPGLWAQNPSAAPAASSAKQPDSAVVPQPTAYVRRFSAGGSLVFGFLSTMKSSTYTNTVTDELDYTETGTIKSSGKLGTGPTFQFAFLEHFAVNVSILRRTEHSWEYDMTRYDGEDLDTTSYDDRVKTTEKHHTWARNYDVPVLIRYYRKGHHQKGWRWFVEGGPTFRQTRDVRTSRHFTYYDPAQERADVDYIKDAWFENPDRANKKNLLGFTGGVGGQFIDAFGLRIVPEVRFTHWAGSTWEINSVKSSKNQVELVFTLTF